MTNEWNAQAPKLWRGRILKADELRARETYENDGEEGCVMGVEDPRFCKETEVRLMPRGLEGRRKRTSSLPQGDADRMRSSASGELDAAGVGWRHAREVFF